MNSVLQGGAGLKEFLEFFAAQNVTIEKFSLNVLFMEIYQVFHQNFLKKIL